MRMRVGRRGLVVWSAPAGLGDARGARRDPARRRRVGRWLRVGAALTVMGLIGLARVARMRWRSGLLGTGGLLTVVGFMMSSSAVFVPGLVMLIVGLLAGPCNRDCQAAAQMAGTHWHA